MAAWLTVRGALDAERRREILALAESAGFAAGAVEAGAADVAVLRESEVAWVDAPWIRAHLQALGEAVNAHFGFELEGLEAPQVARYGPMGGYDWHVDLGPGPASRRKLSVSILLEAADLGGAFELGVVEGLAAELAPGDALAFPSYLRHRVAPVRAGRRTSLVGWFTGPPFR
mgnify:CR=1 FL=1